VTFGEVFFIRSNLGLELRVGNNDRAEAAMEVMDRRPVFPRHPAAQIAEARLLQDIGEMEYMRRAQREALEWMQANPTEFLRLTVLRFVYYWFGPLFEPVTVTKVAYALLSVVAILGLWLHNPTHADHRFRWMPSTRSGPCRPAVPTGWRPVFPGCRNRWSPWFGISGRHAPESGKVALIQ
jgi:hypothetical protein